MSNGTDYALVLKSGEIVKPDPTWERAEDGDIKTIEHWFFWMRKSVPYPRLGTIQQYGIAREYWDSGWVSGIWLSPNFGDDGGRFIPAKDIVQVVPLSKVT